MAGAAPARVDVAMKYNLAHPKIAKDITEVCPNSPKNILAFS